MVKYSLTAKGYDYILKPPRNNRGCVTVKYFKGVILIYMFSVKETYIPNEFKDYIQSLNILEKDDRVLMNTRDYQLWKHNIDAAKQWLLNNKYIYGVNNEFRFSPTKIDQIYNEISNYIEKL